MPQQIVAILRQCVEGLQIDAMHNGYCSNGCIAAILQEHVFVAISCTLQQSPLCLQGCRNNATFRDVAIDLQWQCCSDIGATLIATMFEGIAAILRK